MIQKHFEQFGELSDCVLMQDKTTGKLFIFKNKNYFQENLVVLDLLLIKIPKKLILYWHRPIWLKLKQLKIEIGHE